VKICCIASVEEAQLAIDHGASALGLVSAMPSGPGPIDENLIAQIALRVPPPIATFLLTCAQDVRSIIAQQRRCRTNTLQLCDHLLEGTHDDLRDALPGVGIVQVIHVNGAQAIDEALRVASKVDAILLDSGNQTLAIKQLGGTGRPHDWNISRQIRQQVPVPIFLAGGLNATNVADAIAAVLPFAVDVCTGVRSDGRLDAQKLKAFFAAVGT
jgi:phosphoribosylanthranilate isomerase